MTTGLLVGGLAALMLLAPGVQSEERAWQEAPGVGGESCSLELRAQYDPVERQSESPWPHARFSASGDCIPAGWQSRAALRVIQRRDSDVFVIDEAFDCQRSSGGAWMPCQLTEAPLSGFYRRLWGPIRVASPELARLHAQEQRVLSEVRAAANYERYQDTWSEMLWLHRFCGPTRDVVHHFERWQACLAVMRPRWQQIFDPGEGLE